MSVEANETRDPLGPELPIDVADRLFKWVNDPYSVVNPSTATCVVAAQLNAIAHELRTMNERAERGERQIVGCEPLPPDFQRLVDCNTPLGDSQ